MSGDDHRRHDGDRHEGEAHAAPYPLSRLAPPHDLVDVARQIQQADAMLGAVVHNKLQVIADQIRSLQHKAHEILDMARRDAELHRAVCHFLKRPGKVYHLYERPDGTLYFSMLSPADWNEVPPHSFRGSYRLLPDMSWARKTAGS